MWSPEHQWLLELTRRDPEEAWAGILTYVDAQPETLEATQLIETLMYEYPDAFIDRIEERARNDERFRATVAQAYVGGIAGQAIERFHRLQKQGHRRP
jgi:hypothetical protein